MSVLADREVFAGTVALLTLAQLRRTEHGTPADMIGNVAGRIEL